MKFPVGLSHVTLHRLAETTQVSEGVRILLDWEWIERAEERMGVAKS
jgi:hypothetical protein